MIIVDKFNVKLDHIKYIKKIFFYLSIRLFYFIHFIVIKLKIEKDKFSFYLLALLVNVKLILRCVDI